MLKNEARVDVLSYGKKQLRRIAKKCERRGAPQTAALIWRVLDELDFDNTRAAALEAITPSFGAFVGYARKEAICGEYYEDYSGGVENGAWCDCDML